MDPTVDYVQHRKNVDEITDNIAKGYKVMLIMRGEPGCGKTALALSICANSLKRSNSYSYKDFFVNTEDFLLWELDKAHSDAQNAAAKMAAAGWSPIVIDNPNYKIQDMLPYLEIAIKNGYLIALLEPATLWKRSPYKVRKRDFPGVDFKHVKCMLQRFEPVTLENLLKLTTRTYTAAVPQMRRFPPLTEPSSRRQTKDSGNDSTVECDEGATSRHRRRNRRSRRKNRRVKRNDSNNESPVRGMQSLDLNDKAKDFTRHTIGCDKEDKDFMLLRQSHYDKDLNCLWDLFLKCNGNVNSAADAILEDIWENGERNLTYPNGDHTVDTYQCNCNSEVKVEEETPNE